MFDPPLQFLNLVGPDIGSEELRRNGVSEGSVRPVYPGSGFFFCPKDLSGLSRKPGQARHPIGFGAV